jgi:arylsulfatase A-like enzyme
VASHPNILVLMTDQQRWDALGSVNPLVKTPTLDALAARGIRFSQAVCNVPMCVPSRYSLMLGLYPSQSGVRHNSQIIPRDDLLPVPVLPQRLHELGYQTVGIGKTHWYADGNVEGIERSRRGFEIRAIARGEDYPEHEPEATMMSEVAPDEYRTFRKEVAPYGRGEENTAGYTGRTSDIAADQHLDGWLTDRALDFLDGGRDPDRPFFLYLSLDNPHAGFNVPERFESLYSLADIPERPLPPWGLEPPPGQHVGVDRRAKEWRRKDSASRRRSTLRYYALCTYADHLFGRVLDRLEAGGDLRNTFVLFLSDHGEMLADRGYRFSKYCLYDPAIRVPVICAGPGVPRKRRGSIDDRPAELVDILPTLVEAAGGTALPELPGRSLLGPPSRPGTFTEMHGSGYERIQQAPAFAWRTSEWKLILYLPGDVRDASSRIDQVRGELYRLDDDPCEWRNLYDDPACRDARETLTAQLLMYLATAWASYPMQATGKARLGKGRR